MDKLQEIEFHHQEHQEWISKLNFYQDEIKIFQNELLLVLYEHPENLSLIEHVEEYRRILIQKLKRIDDLRYGIFVHERLLSQGKGISEEEEQKHFATRDEVQEFEGKFKEMKRAFRGFVAHND